MALTTSAMGLRVWNDLGDPYDHTQLANNWTAVDLHDHSSGKGVQVPTAGIVDGAITSTKLAASSVTSAAIAPGSVTADDLADAAKLGLSGATVARRGSVNISTAETTTSTTYGLLTTPDRVTVTLPANGLIALAYQATWRNTVGVDGIGQASAAIFLGTNQLKYAYGGNPSPSAPRAAGPNTASADAILASYSLGLFGTQIGNDGANGFSYTGDVTTGQVVGGLESDGTTYHGGPCYIFAVAGTYDVSVQFSVTSGGSATVKNRKLWVWTLGF